jgi:hypothetical protein
MAKKRKKRAGRKPAPESSAARAERHKQALAKVCPVCGAEPGVVCSGRNLVNNRLHPQRIQKPQPRGKKARSVRTVSAGAFESNRRRH